MDTLELLQLPSYLRIVLLGHAIVSCYLIDYIMLINVYLNVKLTNQVLLYSEHLKT